MTRYESGLFGRLRKRAAIFAALFFCASSAFAQDVTLKSVGGTLEISGRFIAYDGENIQIDSEYGPLTLKYGSVTCEGGSCPDPETYVPELRLSGAHLMSDVLMPALVEGFARSQGLLVTFEQIDPLHFAQTLSQVDAAKPAARFTFRATNTDEGFADLIAHEADIVMSVREVRRREVRLAAEVGLGQLDAPRQSRIVGLDALVPKAYAVSTTLFSGFAFLPNALGMETVIKILIMNIVWIPIHLLWLWVGVTLRSLNLKPGTQRFINIAMATAMILVVGLALLAQS